MDRETHPESERPTDAAHGPDAHGPDAHGSFTPDRWLNWAYRLQSIAQSGLHYGPPPFDRERYEAVLALAAEIVGAAAAGHTPPAPAPATLSALYHELAAGQAGHATPKVDVRGVVFREGRVLLVEEKLDGNRWTLPGGWADPGESAAESVVREVWEETGFRVRAVKLLAVFDRARHHPPFLFHAYKLFFLCAPESGERHVHADNIESGEVGWFARDALPELSVGRVTAAQLARFFRHHDDPSLPTEFD